MAKKSDSVKPQELVQAAGAVLGGLPEPVQTGFLKAAGRLIGGLLATPAAHLRRPAQRVEDKTDAISLVTNRIAQAVAEKAASDPEIVERAMESLVREEFRKQSNKERVFAEATATIGVESSDKGAEDQPESELDDDWLNVFTRYAEDASSERMQKLWGRVLAGEIRKPGRFSLSSIRFLSELDSEIAQEFEAIAPETFADFIPLLEGAKDRIGVGRLLKLEAMGLVQFGTGMLSKTVTLPANGMAHFVGGSASLRLSGTPGTKVNISAILLTRLGRELRSLLPPSDEVAKIRVMADWLATKHKPDIKKLELCVNVVQAGQSMAYPVEVLWELPTEEA